MSAIIDLSFVRQQLDFERRTLAEEGYLLEQLTHVSRLQRRDGTRHRIAFSRLPEASADEVIAQQAAHYRALNVAVEWKVYQHDEPPDLLARVERFGFIPGLRETVMVLDLKDKPAWMGCGSAHNVIRVESNDQVRQYREGADAIFGGDHAETAEELLACIRSESKQHRCYIVAEGDIAVSVGRLYTLPGSSFGGLYGGGTRSQYRNRGFYQAIVATRATDALESGARYLVVDALPTSRPILAKLGFVRLTDTWPCTLTP